MRQPWLRDETDGAGRDADDFSPRTATMPLRRAVVLLAVAGLILVLGRTAQIVDAAYGLPILPGTEAAIAAAEALGDAARSLGIERITKSLRDLLAP